MSKKIYLFSLVLLTLAFVSCEETKEEGRYDNWQVRNEVFIDSLAHVYDTASDRGGLNRVELQSAKGNYIYYKVKTSKVLNALPESPRSTDYVKVYYKGTNMLGEWFDGFRGTDPTLGDAGDATLGETSAAIFAVNGLITGWGEILQYMKRNDRWEVFIPWKYAYGESGQNSILGYSALIFDITLLDFASEQKDLK